MKSPKRIVALVVWIVCVLICATPTTGVATDSTTVFDRTYILPQKLPELPRVAVPDLQSQLKLYEQVYAPYADRAGELPQFALEGLEPLVDIAFSYAWQSVKDKAAFKKPVLQILYAQALKDIAQNRMTLDTYKQHMLRLGVTLAVQAEGPFKNRNLKFLNEKAQSIFFRNPDQAVVSTWMFEAVLFTELGRLDYGLFVDALASETVPLLVSGLSADTPPGFGNAAGFLRHDYGHNYRTAELADVPTIRQIISSIRAANPHLDRKDNVFLFYMFHEMMLRKDLTQEVKPNEAFHNWCLGLKQRVANKFMAQIFDDAQMKDLLLLAEHDSSEYRQGTYQILSPDLLEYTLVSIRNPRRNYLKARIRLVAHDRYLIESVEAGLLLRACHSAGIEIGAPSPDQIYRGETQTPVFRERIEDLKFIFGDKVVTDAISQADFSLLLLFLNTCDAFHAEHRHLVTDPKA